MDQIDKKFIIEGDFCCRSPAVLGKLLEKKYKVKRCCQDKKDPGKTLFFFKMSEKLRQDLEEIFKRPVEWRKMQKK